MFHEKRGHFLIPSALFCIKCLLEDEHHRRDYCLTRGMIVLDCLGLFHCSGMFALLQHSQQILNYAYLP